MIRSLKDKRIPGIRAGSAEKGFPPDLIERAQRKLAQLDAATSLADLRVPPSNQLESLRGDRAGQHSIRINQQWRLCFVWNDGDAFDVEIVDYHRG
jgi:proteic killer suppression protein